MKPIYHPSGVGTVAASIKGAKRRLIKRIRRWRIARAPSAIGRIGDDLERYEEQEKEMMTRHREHLCRCAEEDELLVIAIIDGERN